MDETARRTGDLGEFLRSRRARVRPEEVGVVSYGTRRVPGLRREELAMLAGVSPTYYTRLEQGQSTNASASVIDALARALGLGDDERAHLHDLARPTSGRRPVVRRPDRLRAGTRTLVDALGVPAVVMGRATEVLAWNRSGHALLAGHVDVGAPASVATRPNLTRMLFLDPHTRELYADWDREAGRSVASLRVVAGRFPDDRGLAELIGELSMASSAFARRWARHPVQNCTHGFKDFHHPEIGSLRLGFEVLHLPDETGHRLLTYTAAPGSADQHALDLLDQLTRSGTTPQGAGVRMTRER